MPSQNTARAPPAAAIRWIFGIIGESACCRLCRHRHKRHSFAVNALVRWYRQGVDVQAKLPFLAAYMGHVSPLSTYYYLHFVGPLRTLASRRFAKHYARLVRSSSNPKGGAQ
jgi:integrase/recombinase XerD